jgi:phosphate starvation-inducible PhoH-like protein
VNEKNTGRLTVSFDQNEKFIELCGIQDENLKAVEKKLNVRLFCRGNALTIEGADTETVMLAENVLKQLYSLVLKGHILTSSDVQHAVSILSRNGNVSLDDIFLDTVHISGSNARIGPRGAGQKEYLDAIRKNDIVFAIGPAGTGKTYLAMAMAVSNLLNKDFKRIILTRPAVEAGEKLGFLPGDMIEKVNPYLRPLYDALHDMMDFEKAMKLIEKGMIEIAPIAFMRGRTLNDSFVILDEAQNSTREQMKMFLTRLGFGSKAVVTGDITQVDLPRNTVSGLIHVIKIVQDIQGIKICYFDENDVVRHPVVKEVIKAYEEDEKENSQ